MVVAAAALLGQTSMLAPSGRQKGGTWEPAKSMEIWSNYIRMMKENRFCVECEAVVGVGPWEMVEERRLRKVEN